MFAYRLASQRLRADSDGLLLRNTFVTKRWRWSEIDDFRAVKQSSVPWSPRVPAVVLRDGDIVAVPAFGPSFARRRRADEIIQALRQWLPGGRM